MLVNLVHAVAMIFVTTFVHMACTVGVIFWLRSHPRDYWSQRHPLWSGGFIAAIILVMAFAAYVEAGAWAVFYVVEGALPTFSEAIYFSLVTFTTLGYGDIILDERWRVLAAFEAANGIIMFGWTTAIIVAAVQRVFIQPDEEKADD